MIIHLRMHVKNYHLSQMLENSFLHHASIHLTDVDVDEEWEERMGLGLVSLSPLQLLDNMRSGE